MMILFSTNCLAELPPVPTFVGELKRDEHGKLIVLPVAPILQANELPQASTQHPPTTTNTRQKENTPPSLDVTQTGRAVITPQARGSLIDNRPPNCANGAITCVEAISTSDNTQANVPLTFGQPFKAGDLPKGSRLSARDNQGSVPLQMDEESSYDDGSIRFAVLSTQIANFKPRERRVINLYKDMSAPNPKVVLTPNPSSFDIKLSATIYSPQITLLTFGNRNGSSPGVPFEIGEKITMQLGDALDERFTLIVTPEQAGGNFSSLTKIAYAFHNLINNHSKTFRAYKIGEAGGYENLWITTKRIEGQAFSVKFFYSGKAKMSTAQLQTFSAPKRFEASGNRALENSLRAGSKPRLQGTVASEYALLAPFIETSTGKKHPQLTARLHARFLENNRRIRTDIILENNWAYEPNPGNLTYDLTVEFGNKEVLRQAAVTHYHHSRWHKVLWTLGEEPQAKIRHHMPYFIATKATWNYDLSLNIPAHVLAEEESRLVRADTQPMGAALLTQEFGTTGGRQEIGPLPRWTALFIVTQDARAEKSMFANADAAGSVPIHYRDAQSDLPLSIEAETGRDRMPTIKNADTPWRPDLSHQGSFAYFPYLISGDLYYQEETLFWATFNLNRGNNKGLINDEQIRGQAWAMRSIGEASRILPDKHTMKSYFKKRLDENLTWYVERYSSPYKTGVSPLGCIVQGDKPNETAPWQDDFMTIVIAQLAENQEQLATKYLQIIGRCSTDRWIHEDQGFCRHKSAGYWIKIRNENGTFMRNWLEVFRANWPEIQKCYPSQPMDGYPGSASGYVAYANAALAVASDFGIVGAKGAYHWLSTQTPSIKNAFAQDPTWAIVPRNSDSQLGNSWRP